LHDRRVWLAVLAQFGAAISVLLRDYDAWLTEPGVDWRIRRRFGLVLLRWVIVLIAAWSMLAAFPFYAVALVAVCTLATIALELYPNRVLRAFNAPHLAAPPAQGGARAARRRR
jgi:hypothetical protein